MAGLSNHLQYESEAARQSGCHQVSLRRALLWLCVWCLAAICGQVSEQVVFSLRLLCDQLRPTERIVLEWMCRMKEAELFWSRGEQTVALRAIASLHSELDQV